MKASQKSDWNQDWRWEDVVGDFKVVFLEKSHLLRQRL